MSLSLCVSCPLVGLFQVFVCSEGAGGGGEGGVYPPGGTGLFPQGQRDSNAGVEQVCRY